MLTDKSSEKLHPIVHFKANYWDATLDVKSNKMGAEIIIHDMKGEVIATCRPSIPILLPLSLVLSFNTEDNGAQMTCAQG